MYAKVLIEYNNKQVDKTFTYKIPDYLTNLQKGMKVTVPFGIGSHTINGFVTDITDTYEGDYDIKEIIDVKDPELILNEELLAIGEYLKELTLCSTITAYQTMLPSSLKVKDQKSNYTKYITYVELVSEEKAQEFLNSNPVSKTQKFIIEDLLNKKRVLKTTYSSTALKVLITKGLVQIIKEQQYRLNYQNQVSEPLPLTEEQAKAVEQVEFATNNTYLLYGVTASGKTEVYMQLIAKALKNHQTAILLVPEITLTTQIVNRFYARFGNQVAILHSGLSDGEKYDEYLKILRGEVSIVIGARSAIFAPLKNIGIIIIDEEHSPSYKQETNPRYHALDIAKFRSKYHQAPLILGSATPTLESMARAEKGVYHFLSLTNRIGAAQMPSIELIDMRKELKNNRSIISKKLLNKMQTCLANHEQIILLLNRRGHSTTITCQNCGYIYKCPYCDITLTYHKSSNVLRCHYCGYSLIKKDTCPNCHEEGLIFLGTGTEKLEEEIQKLLPTSRIVRMDADTTQNKGTHQKIIDAFANHEYDILLGTQMISKGLDFPNVTLVGVINADASLNIPDFRSSETTYALLSQASGRAGRSNKKGQVYIQSYNPDNYTLKCVTNNNYLAFYRYEMQNRKLLSYPPYYYLTSLKVASKSYDLASSEINKVKKYLEEHLTATTIILGPTPAANFRVNNVYRFQIILKYKKEPNLLQTLQELDHLFLLNNQAFLEIDLNPVTL